MIRRVARPRRKRRPRAGPRMNRKGRSPSLASETRYLRQPVPSPMAPRGHVERIGSGQGVRWRLARS